MGNDTTAPQVVPYSQDFSEGKPDEAGGWENYVTNEGRIEVVNGQLRLNDATGNSTYSLTEAILHLDMGGTDQCHQTRHESNTLWLRSSRPACCRGNALRLS